MPPLAGKRVALIDGEMTSWYGSRAIAGLVIPAALPLARERPALAEGRAHRGRASPPPSHVALCRDAPAAYRSGKEQHRAKGAPS